MAEQVKVTSIDILEQFRSSLIVFLTKARRSVDEVTGEVRRTRQWIDGEQRLHWERQLKKRQKMLEQAEAELMTARFSEFIDSPTVQQMQVRKARRAVEEAAEKLQKVKKWSRDFDTYADPLVKKLDSLRFYLDQELPKGVAYLSQQQRTLESYAETPLPVADVSTLGAAPVANTESPATKEAGA